MESWRWDFVMQRAEVWEKPQRIACWFQRNNPEDWLWKTRVYQDLCAHWERPPGRSLHNTGLPLTGQHGVQETRQMGHAGWACCSSCVRSKHKLFTNLAPIGEQFPSGHSLTEELARLPRSYRWPSLYPHRVGGRGRWSLGRGPRSHIPHSFESRFNCPQSPSCCTRQGTLD